MSTLETQYREYLRNNRGGFCSFEEWKEIHGNQIKQALIEMMEKDEELGLYDDIKANRIELVCKDCSDSLEDCTCIITTVDLPKQEPKKVLTEEDIFNQKDIDAVTDYINKEQQKQHLIDMMESDEELGLYDEKIEDIELEEVRGSSHCQFSVVENKLAIIYRNQLKILQAIKMLNDGKRN